MPRESDDMRARAGRWLTWAQSAGTRREAAAFEQIAFAHVALAAHMDGFQSAHPSKDDPGLAR